MRERAVSHMVGFVLIFGIIVAGATFSLVVGQNAINEVSGFEQNRNADRAMTLMGQDIDHLAFSRSSSSESAINIDNGQIRYEDLSSSIDVEVAGPGWSRAFSNRTGSIVFEKDDITLRYENGMVIRSVRGAGTSLTEAEFSCRNDKAIVSIVTLQGNADRQLGSGRITVDTFLNETKVVYPLNRSGRGSASNAESVTIEVSSPTDDVWDDVLNDSPNWNSLGSGRFECDVGSAGHVYVRQSVIDVEFQR